MNRLRWAFVGFIALLFLSGGGLLWLYQGWILYVPFCWPYNPGPDRPPIRADFQAEMLRTIRYVYGERAARPRPDGGLDLRFPFAATDWFQLNKLQAQSAARLVEQGRLIPYANFLGRGGNDRRARCSYVFLAIYGTADLPLGNWDPTWETIVNAWDIRYQPLAWLAEPFLIPEIARFLRSKDVRIYVRLWDGKDWRLTDIGEPVERP